MKPALFALAARELVAQGFGTRDSLSSAEPESLPGTTVVGGIRDLGPDG